MVDNRSKEVRSRNMRRIGTRNTAPEIAVRKILHSMGYRFRLHRADLPGTPDIVLPGKRKVIFVNGCFWHGHSCTRGALPKSRVKYWKGRIDKNRARDVRVQNTLCDFGWGVLTVWQCEIRDEPGLQRRLMRFLGRRAMSPMRHPVSRASANG
jgi:DNA mismatch endonuclease (patch repair protein)